MNSKLLLHLMKECFIPNHLVSLLCDMCSCLDEQEALFARVQKSTCVKVMPTVCIMLELAEWENELNVSNEMHCICFLQKQSHTHTNMCPQNVCWYLIFDMCCMINFVRDVIWICKDRINTQIPIVLFKHHISNFGASPILHSRKQCLLFIQAWTHTTQKWYQMIWDKTLFHTMYNNLLFIDDFKNN